MQSVRVRALLSDLLPSNPLRAPLGQVLALRNQTLVNRTGQQGDAVPADLVAEVLMPPSRRFVPSGRLWLLPLP
jgi:hypothetical protein